MKRSSAVFFIFSILVFSGCVRYYKTSYLQNYFSKPTEQINQLISKAESDYKSKREIYDAVIPYVPDTNMQPYPLLQNNLNEMKSSIDTMKNHRTSIIEIQNEFGRISAGKSRIQSDKPEWKSFHALKDRLEQQFNQLKTAVSRYENASQTFTSLANSHKISNVNSDEIKKKLTDYTRQVTEIVKTTQSGIIESKKQLDQAAAKGYDPSEIQRRKILLSEMETLLVQIENENKIISELTAKFEKEAGARKIFWIGPGMITHTILAGIQNKGDQISALGNQFSAKVNEFNNPPAKKKK